VPRIRVIRPADDPPSLAKTIQPPPVSDGLVVCSGQQLTPQRRKRSDN
jgi:hypothetical protein